MFRPHAFVTVGQEHHQGAGETPFGFGGAQVLIDNGLRIVRKISELGLPQDQRPRIPKGIAVFKT